jgi:hypothetical protein
MAVHLVRTLAGLLGSALTVAGMLTPPAAAQGSQAPEIVYQSEGRTAAELGVTEEALLRLLVIPKGPG